MTDNENLIPIPGRLHSVATEGHVSGADEIYDDVQQKDQETINSELIEAVGTGGSVDTRITNAVNVEKTRAEGAESTLDSKITAEQTRATSAENALDDRVDTLEEAVGTGGSVDSRITSAVATETSRAQGVESTLQNGITTEVTRAQGAETELDNRVTTNESNIEALQEAYRGITQGQLIPKTSEEWAAMTSWEEGVVYRVQGTTSYTDYMYNGTTTIKMAEYDNAIDSEPTAGSDNLVKSGGVEKSYIKMPYQTISSSLIRNAVINIGSPSWSVKKYRIESGIIILQGNVYSEGDYYDIAFFSDYDNVTSSDNLIAREHLTSATQRFVVPDGAKCVCISCNATTAPNEIISFSPRDYSYIVEDAEKTYLPTPYEVVSGYVTSSGIAGAGGLWETHKYRLEQGRLLLENNIVMGNNSLAVGFFNDYDTINNNTFIGSFNESTHDVEIPKGTKCVCISYHSVNAPVKVVNFTPVNLENNSLPVESKTVAGYIGQYGSIANAGGAWITKIFKYHGGYITINGEGIGTLNVDIAFYSDYDNPSQHNVISLHKRTEYTQEFLVPAGAVCFAITTKSNNDNINKVVSFSPNNEQRFIDVENYHKEYIKGNVIYGPFSFNGKTATFVGDSVTRGYTSGSTVTNENYVKIFSERVGLTSTNRAIGGAAFTKGYNEVLTLQEQLEQAAVNSDFLFVAGGSNDWQLNVTDTDFRQAVTNICDYIRDNFNGTVIFITPINCIRTNNNPLPLDYYISTLIEIVSGYGYNIVCGSYFPFPSKSGVADAVFGDNIHPSELGYKIYAGSLQSVLENGVASDEIFNELYQIKENIGEPEVEEEARQNVDISSLKTDVGRGLLNQDGSIDSTYSNMYIYKYNVEHCSRIRGKSRLYIDANKSSCQLVFYSTETPSSDTMIKTGTIYNGAIVAIKDFDVEVPINAKTMLIASTSTSAELYSVIADYRTIYKPLENQIRESSLYDNLKDDPTIVDIRSDLSWDRLSAGSSRITDNGDGTYTFTRLSASGGGAYSKTFVSNSDNVRIKIDAVASNGNFGLSLFGILEDQSQIGLGNLYQGGSETHTTVSFDAAYLNVYRSTVAFKLQVFSIGTQAAGDTVTYKISVYEGSEIEKTSIYDKDFEPMMVNIDNSLGLKANKSDVPIETILISPNGNKFVLNVDNSGNITTAPIVPNKVVFVGNSLLAGMGGNDHGGFYGMCASSPYKDYAYYVEQEILTKNPSVVFTKVHGGGFEQSENMDSVNSWWNGNNIITEQPTKNAFTSDIDLVIIQLGDNINNSARVELLNTSFDVLINNIRQNSPSARIIWVDGWFNAEKNHTIISSKCNKWKIPNVFIKSLNTTENQGVSGMISTRYDGTTFVVPDTYISHPGDNGFELIADMIISTLNM